MLDMSWGEMMVIGAIALIVIGPKDLPKALRTLGNMTAKIRRMAGEFQGQFREAMREAELEDVKRDLQGMSQSVTSLNQPLNPIQSVRDELKGAIEAPVEPNPGLASASDAGGTGAVPAEPALAAPAAPDFGAPSGEPRAALPESSSEKA